MTGEAPVRTITSMFFAAAIVTPVGAVSAAVFACDGARS